MTDEAYRLHLQEIETWANNEANLIIFRGCRPVSVTAKVDDLLREAAIAIANKQAYKDDLDAIQETMYFLNDTLDAIYYGQDLPEPENDNQRRALEQVIVPWL